MSKLANELELKWQEVEAKEESKRRADCEEYNKVKKYSEASLDYMINDLAGDIFKVKGNIELDGNDTDKRKSNKAKVVACLSRSRIKSKNL